ncbi:MAG TPA: tetratricopeptide repeat protein, partial [Candidatus Goldiibacteriota bacterium]|nr:tetratricopeptide repeat protein [Candidatus Goldiibacteriota bacterium]
SYLGYLHMLAARNTAVNKQQANELLDRARQYYEKAVEPDKQWFRDNISMSSSYSNLAIIYFNSGKVKMAEDTFNRGLELWPQYREGYYNLAMLYENTGNLPMAAQTYKRVLSVFPNDEKALAELNKLSGRGIK